MSGSSSPDYKALFLKAEEERKRAEEERKRAEERERQAEERERQQRERNRPTPFQSSSDFATISFGGHSERKHRLAPRQAKSRSYRKHCPLRLRPWTDCEDKQRNIYESVCRYLQPPKGCTRVIYVTGCFRLGNGIWFDNHPNALDDDNEVDASQPSTTKPSKPDQFCIYQRDGNRRTLLTTVEYKPPHKLSSANLRLGLRPMDFWREVVQPDRVPTEEPEKSRYHAERLVGSAIVQEFHVMIQEGLEYSYLTNGLMDVQLWVPYDDPTTLYYHLSDPGIYGMAGVAGLESQHSN
ncbi:unnamed protein product [Penicillium nalgiovense]|nr:unnamed protein product [Penicillium nalgiovense]